MKKLFSFLTIFLFCTIFNAQNKPDYTINLENNISHLNLHQTTGVVIVTTDGGIYGINENGEKIWEFKESGLIKSLNILGQDGGSSFAEINMSPFGQFAQTIFNIKTGNKIIDHQTNQYEKLLEHKFLLGDNAILFLAKTDKNKAKLFFVNIENDKILWQTEIETNKKIETLFGDVGGFSSFIQNDYQIAFSMGKTVFLVNKKDGGVVLSKKYDAGKLFFTEDNSLLIAVEDEGGSLLGSTLKAGLTMGLSLLGEKPIGKELVAFVTKTGDEAWKRPIKLDEGYVNHQFVDGKLFAIHEDGANLYDYHTGKEAWKKEFKKSKIKRIEKTNEGFLVYYKNKKHLVDNDGKKIWKKPESVIKDVDFDIDDEENFTVFNYDKGTVLVTPYRIEYFEKGDDKRVYKIRLDEEKDKLVYDDKNNNLILLSKKELYIINPDKGLGKDEMKKIDFEESDKINTLEVRNNSYFIHGNWEYAITDFNGNLVKKEYFAQPGEGLRHLKNLGSSLLAIGAAELSVSSSNDKKSMTDANSFVNENNYKTEQKVFLSKYHDDFEQASKNLYTPERYNAFKATKNSAFFYTKKDDKKVLLQVNKDTGAIENTFEFGVNNPEYIIDENANKIFFSKGNDLFIFSYK